jgi:hypothetical protein
MKTTVVLFEDITQINLVAENDFEKRVLEALKETDSVTIHQGAQLNLCRGGYIRNFSSAYSGMFGNSSAESMNEIALVIQPPKPITESAELPAGDI